MKQSNADLRVNRFGTPPISAKKFPENDVCSGVFLNRLFYDVRVVLLFIMEKRKKETNELFWKSFMTRDA